MSALDIVSRLDFCKPNGKDQWTARCPAHDDRGPSLSIKELSDGRVLINCFAGCGALDVLTAVGLEWDALFPPELEHYPARRRPKQTETVDSLVIEIFEHDRRNGKRPSKADIERYREALKRRPEESDAIVEIAYQSGAIR